ncbi:pyruvate:ferredoxin oxidoreductase, beta subunit [Methanocella arvoryzae MRE50]|uniref:Pyruvate:ferredoxin oxidoreductase, beta subunit n=2 Tax=Methanocella TaxID=570266 RepID=Q0W166_METAR|nr:pyruvate:ferredoxin oxidoreductase, beta subunit [Methanocella arvoryzae MRE50]
MVGNMLDDIPREEYLYKGNTACAGCTAMLALRYILKAAGKNTIIVNPACCSTVCQGSFPKSAYGVPVLNIAFAAAAAAADGIASAARNKGKNVIVFAGDGGTVDIGIQALSGAIERNANILYVCYDNEAYSNTGMQKSGSTPYGAITTTTPTGRKDSKKDIDFIVMAHRPAYMATASAAFPRDLLKKTQKALSIEGTKFLHIHVPCPSGWRYPTEKSIELGKLAVRSGMWFLYEYENGKVTLSPPTSAALKKPAPIDDYIRLQGRFKGADIESMKREVELGMQRIRGLVQ